MGCLAVENKLCVRAALKLLRFAAKNMRKFWGYTSDL